jgi:carbamoyl-phosphate synthase small subunit
MKPVRKDRPEGGDFFKIRPAYLHLADGTRYAGAAPGWQEENYTGEVVFNTGMTGYVESLTDPSYAGQILVFTYPLIGNYGVPDDEDWESPRIHAAGVVVSEACTEWSHSGSHQSLLRWLRAERVPIITGVDTRALTKHLRTDGTMPGVISRQAEPVAPAKLAIPRISISQPITYNDHHQPVVILVDCGTKTNILRSLMRFPAAIKRVPHDYDYTTERFDGVVFSNGPGDPTDYQATIAIAKKALEQDKPLFGICLGSQVMALAAGAKTYKLQYGHRGHNQPCITGSERCYITSQNHGYAIDEKTLPRGWKVLFRNLNDYSVEGIEHATRPFFSVQFHPEASPGPTDTAWLFKRFFASL